MEHRFRKPTVKVLYGLNFILVHLRLQSDKINKDNRVEIPEAWMRATKKHNNIRSDKGLTLRTSALA